MKARYNRISSINQNLARQTSKASKDEVLFEDIVSGAIPFDEREQGRKLINAVENGEVNYISVSSIDRLGRNTLDILQTIEFFKTKNTVLNVDKIGESMIDGKPNHIFNLIIGVMGSISEMERQTILERQREGIAIAVAKGVYKGRVKGSKEDKKDFLFKYKNVIKHLKKGQSLRNTAKLCEVSLGTVQKVKRLME